MDKRELLTIHGKSKIKDIAGILHNYTPNGTIAEAEELENMIHLYENSPLFKVFGMFEDLLELN